MKHDEAVLSIFDTLVTSSRYPMMPNGNVLRQLMVSYGCWDLLRSLKTRPYANLWSLAWEILFFGSTSAKLKSSRNCCVCGVWLASKAWGRNWNMQNSQAFAVHWIWTSQIASLFGEVTHVPFLRRWWTFGLTSLGICHWEKSSHDVNSWPSSQVPTACSVGLQCPWFMPPINCQLF